MASPYLTARAGVKAALGCALLVLLAACGGGAADEETADTPSGYPVPRWISVRGAPASMRAGPGLDYPVLWQFDRSGAPRGGGTPPILGHTSAAPGNGRPGQDRPGDTT